MHPTEASLMGELGGFDPAESQTETLAAWAALVRDAGEWIRVGPSDGEWSAMEVMAHLVSVELANGLRYRAMLTEETPVLVDYDQAAWSGILNLPGVEPEALLALFRALREANLRTWASLDPAARARRGIHPECGPESIELRFRMLAGHDRMHLAQAHRAVEAAASAGSTGSASGAGVAASGCGPRPLAMQ
jgi:hypothetical protein